MPNPLCESSRSLSSRNLDGSVTKCVGVCVDIPSILDVRLVDAPAGVIQDFFPAFFGACLIIYIR